MDKSEAKKYRERANRAWRDLRKEKERYGWIDDSSGKRYRAPVYYLLSGDPEKALELYRWYEAEFPDDIGEPAFDLYWALAAYRTGDTDEAWYRLKQAMIHNLYMLPYLFGEKWDRLEIWHGSNQEWPEYLADIDFLLEEVTEQERGWIREAFYSEPFTRLRKSYMEHGRALQGKPDLERRREILKSWRQKKEELLGP